MSKIYVISTPPVPESSQNPLTALAADSPHGPATNRDCFLGCTNGVYLQQLDGIFYARVV